jgi:hypothetical protein
MNKVIKSEWTKFASIKSNWFFILVIVCMATLISGVASKMSLNALNDSQVVGTIASTWINVNNGLFFNIILLNCLIAILTTNEYTFSTIQTSLLSVPNRLKLFIGKLGISAIVSFLVYLVSMVVSFIVSYIIFPNKQDDLIVSADTNNHLEIKNKYISPSFIDTFFSTDFKYIFLYSLICVIIISFIICGLSFIVRSSVGMVVIVLVVNILITIVFTQFESIKIIRIILNLLPMTLVQGAQNTVMDTSYYSPNMCIIILLIEAIVISFIGYIFFKKRSA